MATGSALLYRGGHYSFGNADANSSANQGNLANNILQNEQNRRAQIQSNAASNDPNVSINEGNALLEPKKRKVCFLSDFSLLWSFEIIIIILNFKNNSDETAI